MTYSHYCPITGIMNIVLSGRMECKLMVVRKLKKLITPSLET